MSRVKVLLLFVIFSFSAELQARICISEEEHYRRLGFATSNVGSPDENGFRESTFVYGRPSTFASLKHKRSTQKVSGLVTNIIIGDDVFEAGQPPIIFDPEPTRARFRGMKSHGNLIIAPVIVTINSRKFGLLLNTKAACNEAMKSMYSLLLDAYKNRQEISIRATKIQFFDVYFDADTNAGEYVRGDNTLRGGLIYAVEKIPKTPQSLLIRSRP